MNTLFRKGYLLAGVIMAANMFVVNEVKATEEGKKIEIADEKEIEEEQEKSGAQDFLDIVLSYENTINLVGGTVSSVANNYLKWWDYDAGRYLKLRNGCLGWRTKKFFDIVQVDINLNVGRGISWVILGAYNCAKFIKDEMGNIDYGKYIHVSFLVSGHFSSKSVFIGIFLIQGFVSAPLIFHISNFSIAISLDSILWGGIGMYLGKCKQGEQGKKKGDNEIELDDEDNKSEKSQEASEEKDN